MNDPPAEFDLVVAGGGAAGFFAAITCAETAPGTRILILEKSREVLGKVRISGGGRCNVTHACFDPRELTSHYPRGSKQLIGPFHHWGPADTIEWFESRGVPLKTEDDGRVFPVSDRSQNIVDCLTGAARDAGIAVRTSAAVIDVDANDSGFHVRLENGETLRARCLLLTTGGTRARIGADLAEKLGHRVEPAAPSLFTFKIHDPRIDGLQGLSVECARVCIPACDLDTTGPVLVTHWGLSGPAILRLSALGARRLQSCGYRSEVSVNWCGLDDDSISKALESIRTGSPRKSIANDPQFGIPARLWKRLADSALKITHTEPGRRWAHLSRETSSQLVKELTDCRFQIDGKTMNKEEFVTCGGVHLPSIHVKTMESRIVPGLYFAGEVLDIDGLTGGFNFQAAWTTGRIAGLAAGATIGS